MAIFNTARLMNVLVRGRIAEQAPAAEFVQELEEQMENVLSNHPTHDRLSVEIGKVLLAIAEMEARQAQLINQAVRIILAGLAIAVGILVGVYLA